MDKQNNRHDKSFNASTCQTASITGLWVDLFTIRARQKHKTKTTNLYFLPWCFHVTSKIQPYIQPGSLQPNITHVGKSLTLHFLGQVTLCQCHSRGFLTCPKPNKIPNSTTTVEHYSLVWGWFGVGEDFAYLLSALQMKARGTSNGFSSLCTMKVKILSLFGTRVCLCLCVVTKCKLYPVQKIITKEKFRSRSLFSQGYRE